MKREQCELSENKIELDRIEKRLREEEISLSSKKKKFNEDVAAFNKRNESFKLHLKEFRERKEVERASAAQLPPTPATKEPAPSAQFDALALTYQSFAELSLSEFQALTSQELEELFVDCKVSTIHTAKFRNLHKILVPGASSSSSPFSASASLPSSSSLVPSSFENSAPLLVDVGTRNHTLERIKSRHENPSLAILNLLRENLASCLPQGNKPSQDEKPWTPWGGKSKKEKKETKKKKEKQNKKSKRKKEKLTKHKKHSTRQSRSPSLPQPVTPQTRPKPTPIPITVPVPIPVNSPPPDFARQNELLDVMLDGDHPISTCPGVDAHSCAPGTIFLRKFEQGWSRGVITKYNAKHIRYNCEVQFDDEIEGNIYKIRLDRTEYLSMNDIREDAAVGSWLFVTNCEELHPMS
jgi:hypothetical protein